MPGDSDKKDDLSERIETFISELKQGYANFYIYGDFYLCFMVVSSANWYDNV